MTDDVAQSGISLSRRKFALGLAFASVAGVAAARQPSKTLDYLGESAAQGFLHDFAGLTMFAVALATVFVIDSVFTKLFKLDTVGART